MKLDYVSIALLMFVLTFIRYVAFSGGLYGLVWVKLGEKLKPRKILFSKLKDHQIRSEIFNSFTTTITYGIILGMFLNQSVIGSTKIYFNVSDYGVPYLIFSLVLIFILHDVYFYLTHRLLHTPFLFRTVHSVHHRSSSTTPWTSYSFHPVEALILVLFMPLVVFVIPMHMAVLTIFGFGSMAFNVLGHCGYELMPKSYSQKFWYYFLNTATHHSLHHTNPKTNFSLYFNYMDRWLSTNHTRYKEELVKMLDSHPQESVKVLNPTPVNL